ncbi:hypothetical protein HZB74_00960 [Candidatus Saccharibacteria bacterium]|nr:hypothetical protein [Candidatus Saccharibacteria bacterium]
MRTTQRKGDIALTQAVATFTKLGYDISLPITESAHYDMVVDFKDKLVRVQVKYCGTKEVDLRLIHSNSRGYVVKKSKENSYDWLYILEPTGREYLILECLPGRRSITPNESMLLERVIKPALS